MVVTVNMGDFRAACRRAAAGEEFKMVDHKQLSPGARVVLHCLVRGGGKAGDLFAQNHAELLPGFYRELLQHGLISVDGDCCYQPTERGRRSNEKLLASGWKLIDDVFDSYVEGA